jgi:pimeloyl-ACP methyl ester carboxylesterase
LIVNVDPENKNLLEYFDFLSETLGYPPLHRNFTSDVVESDGLKLHIDVYEYNPKAPTVIFIPGTAIYAMCYAELMYKIGESGYNVIGIDPRGHGRSQGERGNYTVEEIMKDVENVISYAIDRFNNKVSLMGSSQGGIVAFYIAAKDKRIQTVVCQNIADLASPESHKLTRFPSVTKYLKPIIANFGHVFSDTQIPLSAYLNLDLIKIKYFGTAANFIEKDPIALKSVSLRALRSLATTPLPAPVESIETPVLVIQGSYDTIFPVSYTQKIFDKLQCKKELIVFPELSHAIMTENVEEIYPPIINWLNSVYNKKSRKRQKNAA